MSDGSSDVYSSDLTGEQHDRRPARETHDRERRDRMDKLIDAADAQPFGLLRSRRALRAERARRDTKSGVEGQRVSVRVDLGGRCITSKKNIRDQEIPVASVPAIRT